MAKVCFSKTGGRGGKTCLNQRFPTKKVNFQAKRIGERGGGLILIICFTENEHNFSKIDFSNMVIVSVGEMVALKNKTPKSTLNTQRS